MTDADFQNLIELLADETPLEQVFEQVDPESLTLPQRKELALYLRTQALIREEVAGGDAFVRRVMAWADAAGKDTFTAKVMDSHATARAQATAATPAPPDTQASTTRPKRNLAPWWVALAACVVATASWWRPASPSSATGNAHLAVNNAVAVLVDELDAAFANGQSPQKTGFSPGTYKLETGLAHVRMINGTDLVLKAPVAFEIEDPMRIRLRQGDMRVVVPDTAHGFIVATEGVDYQDLGTEFGVSAEGGSSQMHVFNGQVDVLKQADGTKMESVTLGQTVAFAQGTLSATEAPDKDRFPSASDISMRRWSQLSAGWRDDPALLCYYTFQKDANRPRELQDAKSGGVPIHANIKGARWVTGRWPGKDALFFDHDDDQAEVEIPGEYAQLTVAAWVLLDRFDFPNNAIFASNGWEAGDFHMNLNGQGRLFGGTYPRTYYTQVTEEVVQPGVWSLVVLVSDEKAKTAQGWINGRLAYSGNIQNVWGIRPGICRIGGCNPKEGEGNPIRTLRGRIDELFVWKRPLGKDEINKMYEEGRPSLLEGSRRPATTDAP